MDDQCKYNTYTCYIYNQLQFIDHTKNTLSYSINHALIKACISQYSFQFQYAHKFNSVLQFNSVMSINSIMPINSIMSINSILPINSIMPYQFNYVNQFNYALNEFNLCLQYTGYQSHRHGPAGLQAGIKTVL